MSTPDSLPTVLPSDIPTSLAEIPPYVVRHWREEMEVISGAPFAFTVAVIVTGIILWFIFRFRHGQQLDQIPLLKTQLDMRDDFVSQLQHQLTATKIATTHELTKVLRASVVHERITASQLEGNTIVLKFAPIPESVVLILSAQTHVLSDAPSTFVQGRKLLLEALNDPHLLGAIHYYVPTESVIVQYRRDFSPEELEEIKRKQ